MNKLTEKFLTENNASLTAIKFVENNKLIGFPFDLLDKVKGDHKGYVEWLKDNKDNIREYDSDNNVIHHKNSNGFEYWKEYDSNNNVIYHKNFNGYEYWNEIEYYNDGRLKRFNELEIPWFEKAR